MLDQKLLQIKYYQGRYLCGFSMLELMVVMLIGIVLIMIALPSLIDIVVRYQVQLQADRLVSGIHYAHNTAMSEGRRTLFCYADNSNTGTARIVCRARLNSGKIPERIWWIAASQGMTAEEPDKIREWGSFGGSIDLLVHTAGSIIFHSSGRFDPSGYDLRILLCGNAENQSVLSFNQLGHPTVEEYQPGPGEMTCP